MSVRRLSNIPAVCPERHPILEARYLFRHWGYLPSFSREAGVEGEWQNASRLGCTQHCLERRVCSLSPTTTSQYSRGRGAESEHVFCSCQSEPRRGLIVFHYVICNSPRARQSPQNAHILSGSIPRPALSSADLYVYCCRITVLLSVFQLSTLYILRSSQGDCGDYSLSRC